MSRPSIAAGAPPALMLTGEFHDDGHCCIVHDVQPRQRNVGHGEPGWKPQCECPPVGPAYVIAWNRRLHVVVAGFVLFRRLSDLPLLLPLGLADFNWTVSAQV